MHELTESEGRVVLALLDYPGDPRPKELARASIPSSTFYSVRKRAYSEGWLSDRYLPHPWALGVGSVEFALASHSAVDFTEVELRWASDPEVAVLWTGPNTVFAVFFRRGCERAVGQGALGGGVASVRLTPSSGSCPAYFDFSALWSRFVGGRAPGTYPRPLAMPLPGHKKLVQHAIFRLLRGPGGAGASYGPTRLWNSPPLLPRSLRRLVETGAVQSRTLLNLESVPPFQGRALGEVVFFTGTLRDGSTGNDLLSAMNGGCGVSPFLAVDDGRNVILATVGALSSQGVGRQRVRYATGPVLPTLRSMIGDLRATVERVDGIRRVVDHTYDRLFAPHQDDSAQAGRLVPTAGPSALPLDRSGGPRRHDASFPRHGRGLEIRVPPRGAPGNPSRPSLDGYRVYRVVDESGDEQVVLSDRKTLKRDQEVPVVRLAAGIWREKRGATGGGVQDAHGARVAADGGIPAAR